MKIHGSVLSFLLLVCISCKEQPLLYTVSLQDGLPLTGEVWKKGSENSFYTDIYITDQYYAFSEYKNDTVLQVFSKNDPERFLGFEVKQGIGKLFHTIDFLKSNTRYASEKDDIWFIENKNELKQLRLQDDLLLPINTWLLPVGTLRSTSFNFTKEEMYGVPTMGSSLKTFYFFQPDSGHYWVEMYGITKGLQYKKNPYAFLSNLCVNEKQKAVVCGFLYFNQIQFFDLKGNVVRSVRIGEEDIMPVNNSESSLDYENSVKCVIDICSTEEYVYCLYDGADNLDKNSLIFVFNWDGTHVKTYTIDKILKKIAIDKSNNKLVALVSNEQGNRDVVSYFLK